MPDYDSGSRMVAAAEAGGLDRLKTLTVRVQMGDGERQHEEPFGTASLRVFVYTETFTSSHGGNTKHAGR